MTGTELLNTLPADIKREAFAEFKRQGYSYRLQYTYKSIAELMSFFKWSTSLRGEHYWTAVWLNYKSVPFYDKYLKHGN
jgi:hypothetical protein